MAGWLASQREARKKDDDEEKSFFLPNSSTSSSTTNGVEVRTNNEGKTKHTQSRSILWKVILALIVVASCLRIGWYWGIDDKRKMYADPSHLVNSVQMNVEEAYHQRLFQIHSNLLSNDTDLHKTLNIHGGIPTYEEYRSRLLETYNRFFSPVAGAKDPYEIWKSVEMHLTPFKSHPGGAKPFPKIISSSAKDKSKVHDTFNSWKEKNSNWRLDLFDDDDAKKFIESKFENLGRLPGKDSSSQQHPMSYLQILAAMPKNIMRVDTYRYFKVFFDGGIYVDSDTGCKKPIEEWPGVFHSNVKVTEESDFILRFLNKLGMDDLPQGSETLRQKGLKALTSIYKSKGKDDNVPYAGSQIQQKQENAEYWTQPSMVMALEEDSFLAKEDWIAMTFARPMQITQWAFLSQPFHPVFLDALATIMERTETFIKEVASNKQQADEGINKVLEWTGPGMLTDAVFRYLGAVHGIHPRQMMYNYKASRLGDTLMYPHQSFRAQDSGDKENEFHVIDHHHLHEWW